MRNCRRQNCNSFDALHDDDMKNVTTKFCKFLKCTQIIGGIHTDVLPFGIDTQTYLNFFTLKLMKVHRHKLTFVGDYFEATAI